MNSDYYEKIEQEAQYWARKGKIDARLAPGWYCNPQIFELAGKDMLDHVALAYRPGGKALDLCCGIGAYSERLAEHGMYVDAFDISEQRIHSALESAKAKGLQDKIHYEVADLNRIEFTRNTYDSVLSHDAIHHIPNLDHLLPQVAGSLKEDGVFVIHEVIGLSRKGKILSDLIMSSLPDHFKVVRHLSNQTQVFGNMKSPFEEVSSKALVSKIHQYFDVIREKTMFGFAIDVFTLQYNWDLSDPSVKALATTLVELDRWMVNNCVVVGSSAALLARKPGTAPPGNALPYSTDWFQEEEKKDYHAEAMHYRQELDRVTSSTAYRFGTVFSKTISSLKRILKSSN